MAQVLEDLFIPKKHMVSKGVVRIIRVLAVFCFCAFAWIFFASKSLPDAAYIIKHMCDGIIHPVAYLYGGFSELDLGALQLFFLGISLLMLLTYDFVSLKKDIIETITSKRTITRWCIYIVFVLWIIFNIPTTDATEFIYFQF